MPQTSSTLTELADAPFFQDDQQDPTGYGDRSQNGDSGMDLRTNAVLAATSAPRPKATRQPTFGATGWRRKVKPAQQG